MHFLLALKNSITQELLSNGIDIRKAFRETTRKIIRG
jgi:hypothetical protein